MSINDELVYKVFYEFKTNSGGSGEAAGSTTDVDEYSAVQQREVLYNPNEPGEAMVLDDLPNELVLEHTDKVVLRSVPKRLFILPGLTIAGNLWGLYAFIAA